MGPFTRMFMSRRRHNFRGQVPLELLTLCQSGALELARDDLKSCLEAHHALTLGCPMELGGDLRGC